MCQYIEDVCFIFTSCLGAVNFINFILNTFIWILANVCPCNIIKLSMRMYVYVYRFMCVCVCLFVYAFIYNEYHIWLEIFCLVDTIIDSKLF